MMPWRKPALIGLVAGAMVGLAGVGYFVVSTPRVEPVDPASVDLSTLDQVPSEAWAELRGKRIYFGHQSVGSNVIAGIEQILQRKPEIGLRVVATSDAGAFDAPGLIHGPIGINGDVRSKMDEFAAVVRSPEGTGLDIALMKFCYADLGRPDNPIDLLATYQSMVDTISGERPSLRILHATVPLTSVKRGPKALVARLLGRRPERDNVARGMYNEALRTSFDAEQIFDIAAAEARGPSGKSTVVEWDGRIWPTLAEEFTNDGGHLNPGGQIVVARDLLLLLAKQASAFEL
jgi:hypothetical protein